MTISCKQKLYFDVLNDPEWPVFKCKNIKSYLNISMLELICQSTEVSDPIEQMDKICATKALDYIYKNSLLSNYDIYLFISHSAWIKDDRISNYKKLWKSLPTKMNISSFNLGSEAGFKSNKGIRYAGLAKIYNMTFLQAVMILRENYSSLMVLTEEKNFDCEEKVRSIFESAFTVDKKPSIDWSNLTLELCKEGNILIRLSGSKDERESSLEFLMLKEKTGLFLE